MVGYLECLPGVANVLRRIEELIGGKTPVLSLASEQAPFKAPEDEKPGYDIETLCQRFRQQDPEPCRRYMVGRGIAEEMVEDLIATGELLHKHHQGKSYCCFEVRDTACELQCLDNYEIEGEGKFILASKRVYSRGWESLPSDAEVFFREGIIDYISHKTLEGYHFVGIALIGNQLIFDASLLA